MTGDPQNDVLLAMWIAFSCVSALGLSAALVWAARSRQFADQDRARYLPLGSGIPPEDISERGLAGDDDVPD